jgi:hypothetical protein
MVSRQRLTLHHLFAFISDLLFRSQYPAHFYRSMSVPLQYLLKCTDGFPTLQLEALQGLLLPCTNGASKI